MTRTLRGAGFNPTVWNRDTTKSAGLASELGLVVASTAAEAASSADVVLTSLADDSALEAVYLGPEGVVEGIGTDSVAVDTSTVDPEVVRRVGKAIDGTGARFLDCPVSGSVATVAAGALTIMVGGDSTTLEQVRPVLEPLSTRIVHMGESGSGSVTKLAVNDLVHGINLALSEALVLAEKGGVERAKAYEVFASGAGGAPFVQYKSEAYLHPESAEVAFTLDLVAKDLELITGLASRVGAPMTQAEAAVEVVQGAIGAGMGDRDLSAIAVYLRELGS